MLAAVRDCWASLFNARAVSYRLRAGLHYTDMPMAVGVVELIHARASGVAFSAHPVTGKTDRVVIETNWGWGEAVVQGLVTPDHIEVGKADGRILKYQVADKTVVSAFDYAAGRVVETEMPARLVSQRVLDDEQITAITDAVLAVERHYGYPVDVEWVLDRHRREGDPICVVQARPVTVTATPIDPHRVEPRRHGGKICIRDLSPTPRGCDHARADGLLWTPDGPGRVRRLLHVTHAPLAGKIPGMTSFTYRHCRVSRRVAAALLPDRRAQLALAGSHGRRPGLTRGRGRHRRRPQLRHRRRHHVRRLRLTLPGRGGRPGASYGEDATAGRTSRPASRITSSMRR